MGELKKISPDDKEFTANGRRYIIEERLSVARWIEYEKQQVEVGFGTSLKLIFASLMSAYTAVNEQRFADAAVILRDIMKGISTIEKREAPLVMKLCMLFINREDEDRTVYDEKLMAEKIEDMIEEGIDINSFFHLAIAFIPGFLAAFSEVTRATSAVKTS